jgi:hypothetical protein
MGITGPLPEHILRRMNKEDRAALGKVGLTASEAQAKCESRLERQEQRIFANECLRRELPFVWHRTDRKSAATLGTPDFIVGLDGQTLWIEFKAPGGILSLEQTKFRERLAEQQITLHICRGAAQAIALLK